MFSQYAHNSTMFVPQVEFLDEKRYQGKVLNQN